MKTLWLSIYFIVLIWSAINPKEYITWFLEVAPAIIGLVVLSLTYNKFKLTTLTYTLILVHCIILMIGGHYTYAEVPLFDYIQEMFEQSRNNYDKVGHFAQGFVPAIIVKELVIRKNIINTEFWQNFFSVCFALAFSAFYELIEWWVALLDDGAEDFLGTQGYIWDTQSDMAMALLGSITAIILLSKTLKSQIDSLK